MPSIDEMLESWKQDNTIDETKLNRELIRSSMLHAKYLEFYVYAKAKLAQAEKKKNLMAYQRKRYYRGELSREELIKFGWEQYQGLKMSNSEFSQQAELDPILVEMKEKVDAYRTMVSTLEYIMKQIGQRDWTIKSIIEYNKFLSGA